MKKYCVLYNPHANNETGEEEAKKLSALYGEENLEYVDVTGIVDYKSKLAEIPEEQGIILCGGDGTLNRFANEGGADLKREVLYYSTGSGNDFLRDLGMEKGCEPFAINDFMKDLPTVTVNGEERYFINGVGYGIDGYCCEVADQLRGKTTKPINYTGIAIKGLLFHYKPTNAVVTIDGKEYNFKKVWIAPTMNGVYYGGGMMPTPKQDRLNVERKVSTMIFHGSGKLKTLMIFPSLFKGEHVKKEKNVIVFEGKEVTVKFDRPVALQIDGETVLGVPEYTVKTKKI